MGIYLKDIVYLWDHKSSITILLHYLYYYELYTVVCYTVYPKHLFFYLLNYPYYLIKKQFCHEDTFVKGFDEIVFNQTRK